MLDKANDFSSSNCRVEAPLDDLSLFDQLSNVLHFRHSLCTMPHVQLVHMILVHLRHVTSLKSRGT